MKKTISIFISLAILLSFLVVPITTKATQPATISLQDLIQSLQEQIQALLQQVLELQEQLTSLKQAEGEVKEMAKEIKTTLQLTKRLWRGMTNEDVELLQEVLATDPEVYPEGLITGYFGPLTERAVKKFQKKMGVEEVGSVGPKTLAKINELLIEGAGSSGKVPPGLLIAPGIRKKIGYVPEPPAGQVLPPGISEKLDGTATSTDEEEEDEIAPVISNVTATSTAATSTRITWTTDEEADSKVWYDTVTPLIIATSTPSISSAVFVTSHDLSLADLTASTTYYYLAVSADEVGNTATSTENSFTTLAE